MAYNYRIVPNFDNDRISEDQLEFEIFDIAKSDKVIKTVIGRRAVEEEVARLNSTGGRDILAVIDGLKAQVPTDLTDFHNALDQIVSSLHFAPPELIPLQWERLTQAVNEYVPMPVQFNWQVRVVALFLQISEQEVRERFTTDATEEREILAPPVKWVNFDEVVGVINRMRQGLWMWVWNTRCKYIELRIDMRDGHCIIRDKDGKRITVEQLQYQLERARPSKTG